MHILTYCFHAASRKRNVFEVHWLPLINLYLTSVLISHDSLEYNDVWSVFQVVY